jgi:hypothetical protein
MMPVVLLSAVIAFWTNFVAADPGTKYPVLAVVSQSPRNLTPWLGPGPIDARVIFAEETSPSNYSFFVCSGFDGKDCNQVNEGSVTAAGLENLVANGVGLSHWDLPIMADLEWGAALPSTRSFIAKGGARLVAVIQAGGRAEMISIRTGGLTNGAILAKQLVYYSGATLKN